MSFGLDESGGFEALRVHAAVIRDAFSLQIMLLRDCDGWGNLARVV
jgi:hypothetical protein